MVGRLRALTRPRVLGVTLAWAAAVWFLDRQLGSVPAAGLLPVDFPPAPKRVGDDLDSRDPRYRPVIALPPPDAPFPRLRPTRSLPDHCLESWFLHGTTDCGRHDVGPEEKLDATWTWVNGSDGRWRAEMEYWRREAGIYSPDQHFRYVPA
jgi:3-O-alpha-D-mannopyranosyl-alpha-D-mannopyranose xylosylphosphotransferase